MKTIELTVEKRSTTGKNEARRSRSRGKIPAVVYGAGKPTAKIIEEAADVWAFLVRSLGME